MAYVVRVETGKGMNRAITQSVPLPNKERVAIYIRKNPLIRSNTNVYVFNTITRKGITGKPYNFTSRLGKFQNS